MLRSSVRALVVGALAPLAVTALAAVPPAVADPAPGVVFLSQFTDGHLATAGSDGIDETLTLAARRSDPTAALTFEYNLDPAAGDDTTGWKRIFGTRTTTGDFVTQQWDGTTASGDSLRDVPIALRVVASGDDAVATSRRNDVTITNGTDGPVAAVGLVKDPTVGFFTQPYTGEYETQRTQVGVAGRMSLPGSVAVSYLGDDGAPLGTRYDTVDPYLDGDRFDVALDLTDLAPATGDHVAFAASRTTDDVQPARLYEQSLGSIEVAYGQNYYPSPSAPIVITVVDAEAGEPVVGAEVRRGSDGARLGTTDGRGRVFASQESFTTESYYANATDADGFDLGDGDVRTADFTAVGYHPEPTIIHPELVDGDVFDADEYAAGDVGITVRDQFGRPVDDPTDVAYRLYPTDSQPPNGFQVVQTAGRGTATVPFTPGTGNREFTLDYRLGDDPGTSAEFSSATFTVGQAVLRLDPGQVTTPSPGQQVEVTGTLAVGDRPLAHRRVALRYVRGVETAGRGAPDAGIVTDGGLVLRRTVLTDENGRFTITLSDPDDASGPAEVGGRLLARTADNSGEPYPATSTGNADAQAAPVPVRFGPRGTAVPALRGSDNGLRADVLRVVAPAWTAGQSVRVLRIERTGARTVVATRRLDANGTVRRVVVPDRNGPDPTTYLVRLQPSDRVAGAESPILRVR